MYCSSSLVAPKEMPVQEPARPGQMDAAIQAEGFIVRTRQLSENIEMPGTLLPFETTQIRPEISGRIVELNIPEGRR